MGSLPTGDSTLVVDVFPPILPGYTFTSKNIQIVGTTTKTVAASVSSPSYERTVINLKKFDSTIYKPYFLYLRFNGDFMRGTTEQLRLIVYGKRGAFADVPSSVFDIFWGLEGDQLKVSADIDIGDKTIRSGGHPLLVLKNGILSIDEPVKAHAIVTDTIEIVSDTLVYDFEENPPLKSNFKTFTFSDPFWRDTVQKKLFKVLTSLRVLMSSGMPITGTLAIEEELYRKPNKNYAYPIPGGLREFRLYLDQNLDPEAINVTFKISGMAPEKHAKLLVMYERHTHL